MENKKNYYENDGRDMRDFNPRFSDLYQGYSDSQQDNHTFNLNGTIYVHNHHGGEPIPVGKSKSPANSKSTARPSRSSAQRERNQADVAGVNRPGADTARTVRPKAKPPVQKPTGTGWIQGQRSEWNQMKRKKGNKAARGFIVGALVLFLISAILPIVAALINFDGDIDFSEEAGYI